MKKPGNEKEIETSIIISRPYGGDEEYISIEVACKSSRATFLNMKIGLEDFSKLITGRGGIKCKSVVRALEVIGMERIHKPLEFEMPEGSPYSDKEVASKEAERVCPKTWNASLYFGSQNSFFIKDGKQWARTRIFKYVDPNETEN